MPSIVLCGRQQNSGRCPEGDGLGHSGECKELDKHYAEELVPTNNVVHCRDMLCGANGAVNKLTTW